jgi:hypothetical protein
MSEGAGNGQSATGDGNGNRQRTTHVAHAPNRTVRVAARDESANEGRPTNVAQQSASDRVPIVEADGEPVNT